MNNVVDSLILSQCAQCFVSYSTITFITFFASTWINILVVFQPHLTPFSIELEPMKCLFILWFRKKSVSSNLCSTVNAEWILEGTHKKRTNSQFVFFLLFFQFSNRNSDHSLESMTNLNLKMAQIKFKTKFYENLGYEFVWGPNWNALMPLC